MELLGYFNAAIEEKDLTHIKNVMQAHGVRLHKSNANPDDNWWFFPLPEGTTKTRKASQGVVPRYRVRLPDGFTFTLEMGPIIRNGYFDSPPQIFLDASEDAET